MFSSLRSTQKPGFGRGPAPKTSAASRISATASTPRTTRSPPSTTAASTTASSRRRSIDEKQPASDKVQRIQSRLSQLARSNIAEVDLACSVAEEDAAASHDSVPFIFEQYARTLGSDVKPSTTHRVLESLLVILENGPNGVDESIETRSAMALQMGVMPVLASVLQTSKPDDLTARIVARLVSRNPVVCAEAMKLNVPALFLALLLESDNDNLLAWCAEGLGQLAQNGDCRLEMGSLLDASSLVGALVDVATAKKDGHSHKRSRACMALNALAPEVTMRSALKRHKARFTTILDDKVLKKNPLLAQQAVLVLSHVLDSSDVQLIQLLRGPVEAVGQTISTWDEGHPAVLTRPELLSALSNLAELKPCQRILGDSKIVEAAMKVITTSTDETDMTLATGLVLRLLDDPQNIALLLRTPDAITWIDNLNQFQDALFSANVAGIVAALDSAPATTNGTKHKSTIAKAKRTPRAVTACRSDYTPGLMHRVVELVEEGMVE